MSSKQTHSKQPEEETGETDRPRPLWQRISAFVLIALIIAATVIFAFWPALGI